MSSDLVRVQSELLQLHLLHRSSAAIQRQWKRSAESKLCQQFESVSAQYHRLCLSESVSQDGIDLRALKDWNDIGASFGLAERVQMLSRTIQEIYSMIDTGGKSNRLVTSFEKWIIRNERLWRSREYDDRSKTQDMEFVEDIGDSWKAEAAVLERRLTSYSHNLECLGHPLEGSSLSYVVACCVSMVTQMLDEVRVMQEIEREVLVREKSWVMEMIDRIDLESESKRGPETVATRRGVWQAG